MSRSSRTGFVALLVGCHAPAPAPDGAQQVVPLEAARSRITGAPDDGLGYTMTMVDLEGDGTPALATGVPFRDGAEHRGGFYVFDAPGGESDLAPGGAAAHLDGSIEGTYFSRGLSSLLQPDGSSSLVVGARQMNGGEGGSASVYVFDGPLDGELALSDASVQLVEPEEELDFGGHLLDGRADLSGDGVADLVVGGPRWHSYRGGAFVFAGPLAPGTITPEDAVASVTADGSFSHLGQGGASAWDLDGDGLSELAVGPYQKEAGILWIFKGPLAGELRAEDWDQALFGQTEGDAFGESVQGGDLDGDGYDDLVVGAPSCDTLATNAGSVAVFAGAAGLPAAAYTYELLGTDQGGGLGGESGRIAVADLDADLAADLVVGVPFDLDAGVATGATYLAFGPLEGVSDPAGADARIGPGAAADELGFAVLAGDLDGDGEVELMVGSPTAGEDDGGFIYRFGADTWMGTR